MGYDCDISRATFPHCFCFCQNGAGSFLSPQMPSTEKSMDLNKSKSSEKAVEDFETSRRGPQASWFKHSREIAVFVSVVAILVWGSGFLLNAILLFHNNYTPLIISSDPSDYYSTAPPLLSKFARPQGKPVEVDGKIPLNFTNAREGIFSPHYSQLQWIKEPNSFHDDRGSYVVREEVEIDGTDEYYTQYTVKSIVDSSYEYLLFNGSAFKYESIEYDIDQLIASPDLNLALLKTNSTHNYRHSTFSLYWILDISRNTIVPLGNEEKIETVLWSPTSEAVAFVRNNNIFIKHIEDLSETQVTFDGNDQVFYGRPDWVYEEEVYASDKTLWWSPSGDKLSFLRMDDTEIPEFSIPYYVQEGYEDYPKIVNLKYPKAGYPNPKIDVGVYEMGQKFKLLGIESANITDKLITQVTWVSGTDILVRISNRASNLLEFFLVNSNTLEYKLVRTHSMEHGWFEVTFDTFYIPKNDTIGIENDGYLDTVVVDGYNHLAYFSPPSNPNGLLLTQGQWEVENGQVAFDYSTNEVYFISTMKSPVERHVHSVNLVDALRLQKTGKVSNPAIKNITDTSKDGYYAGSFSSGSRYLLLTYTGPSIPYQQLLDLKTNEVVKTLETNSKLAKTLDKYAIPKVEHSVVNLGQDEQGEDILAQAVETFPLNFNPKLKYPVLFYVYGGPGSQTVTKRFKVDFSSIAAAELNAIVVTVDGRGTGYNTHTTTGADYKFIVTNQLGHYEPLDQIAAAKIWKKKPYVDPERIAIWGWSYGGFMTLKTLQTDYDHVFKYGCSVAPVTSWKFYDSVYTERYMKTPQENPEGYVTASISNVTNFHGVNRFLLMHGSGDDNVHFQNSLKLIDDFNLHEVENFDFMVFPDSDHSISYHNGNHVIYHRLLKWLGGVFGT